MKAEILFKHVLVFRNVNKDNYDPIHIVLADVNPENTYPRWKEVIDINIRSYETEIFVGDIDYPIYIKYPDGTRRKVIVPKKVKENYD